MADLASLMERLEAATGPDRALDGDLYWALERRRAAVAYWNAALGMPRELPATFQPSGLGRIGVEAASPDFTASLDAALALADRLGFSRLAILLEALSGIEQDEPTVDQLARAVVGAILGACIARDVQRVLPV